MPSSDHFGNRCCHRVFSWNCCVAPSGCRSTDGIFPRITRWRDVLSINTHLIRR